MQEGSIHILLLSKPTDPQPWSYSLMFTPSTATVGGRPWRKVTGDDDLVRLLRDEIGIHKELIDDILKRARGGMTTVPRIQLTPEQLKALGL
jgi:hypothetical protein